MSVSSKRGRVARMNYVVARFKYSGFASERLDHMAVVDDKSIGFYSTQRTPYK